MILQRFKHVLISWLLKHCRSATRKTLLTFAFCFFQIFCEGRPTGRRAQTGSCRRARPGQEERRRRRDGRRGDREPAKVRPRILEAGRFQALEDPHGRPQRGSLQWHRLGPGQPDPSAEEPDQRSDRPPRQAERQQQRRFGVLREVLRHLVADQIRLFVGLRHNSISCVV